MDHGTERKENRGGNRQHEEDIETAESIREHISSFQVRESHYGRGKSMKQYLAPELSIAKMWRLWKKTRCSLQQPVASLSKYKRIVLDEYNIGFGHPKTDVCSRCTFLENQIASNVNKAENEVALQVHKRRGKKFYELLKAARNDKKTLAVSFDMEQNQPLPKTNVTETFYARQMWVYNLTFVIHEPSGQSNNNVFLYTWDESQSTKGSNEVVSALSDFLYRIRMRIKKKKFTKLALFSDSCGGQNKNKMMISFLLQYVNDKVRNHFRQITYYFPVRGHSYMPPDRVFGRIEKKLRRKPIMKTPSEYHRVFSKFGCVQVLGIDWNVLNYKKIADTVLPSNLKTLKTRDNRVWEFKQRDFRIYTSNTFSGTRIPFDVLKNEYRGKSLVNMKANKMPETCCITEAKKTDINNLLPFMGLNSEEEAYYKKILESVTRPGKQKDEKVCPVKERSVVREPSTTSEPEITPSKKRKVANDVPAKRKLTFPMRRLITAPVEPAVKSNLKKSNRPTAVCRKETKKKEQPSEPKEVTVTPKTKKVPTAKILPDLKKRNNIGTRKNQAEKEKQPTPRRMLRSSKKL